MINYSTSISDLADLIETHKPNWLNRAHTRTLHFEAIGKYDESSSIWSEVKEVYMQLQGESKCVFCERKLESVNHGLIEQDVEHFRPKKKVKKWRQNLGVALTNPPRRNKGYFLLAYHLFNYAASCKVCNSTLKSSIFPIKGSYNFTLENPENAQQEESLLIYPIGDFDEKPEDLITFHGIVPMPKYQTGIKHERALASISLFKLNDATERKNLFLERAKVLIPLYFSLEHNIPDLINGYTSPKSPHTNCALCFKSLFEQDYQEAKEIFELCVAFITTNS